MADRMTEEEIKAELAAYAQAVREGTAGTKEWAERVKDAEAGVRNYTATLNASLKGLQTSALATMSALKDGQTGQSVYNDALSKGADAVSDFASKFGIVGAVIGAVVKAATAYVTAVNKQSDALLKGYKEIAKVGATGAEGMSGVFQSMQKFGYGIEELDKMAALIKENSSTLASFGGTAAQGTKQLANLSGELQRSPFARELREMGLSVDDINRASAGYLKTQVMIGKNAATNDRDLADNTKAYIRELNTLSKLTGQSNQQLQEQLETAMKEEAMNQVLYELDQKAKTGTEQERAEATAQAAKLRSLMQSSLPPEVKQELAKAIGGDISAAQKISMIAPNLLDAAMDSNKTFDETMDIAGKDIKTTLDAMGPTAKINAFKEFGGAIDGLRKFSTQYTGDNAKALREEAERQKKIDDPLAKGAIDNEIKQQNSRDAMQSMLQKGIVPVTEGMSKLSGVIDTVTGKAAKTIGAAPAGGAPPLGGGPAPAAPAPAAPAAKPAPATPAPAAPTAPGAKAAPAPAAPAAAGQKVVGQKDLTAMGLTIKQGDVQAEGSGIDNRIIEMAKQVQASVPNFAYFSGFNDKYHQEKAGTSQHAKGMAMDFALSKKPSKEEGASIVSMLQSMGASLAIDEYNNPSAKATAGHMHAQVKGYADGGIAAGPTSGYKAELQGTNAVVPLPSGQQIPVEMPEFNTNLAEQTQVLTQQLSKLDELMRIMQTQVGVSTKILQSQA